MVDHRQCSKLFYEILRNLKVYGPYVRHCVSYVLVGEKAKHNETYRDTKPTVKFQS